MTDVPEADALEQRTPVKPDAEDADPELAADPEVPEADALEQAQVVDDDEDDQLR